MDKIVKIMNEIEAIHPDVKAHLQCLGYAIVDEINGWKDMAQALEEINNNK